MSVATSQQAWAWLDFGQCQFCSAQVCDTATGKRTDSKVT